MREISFRGKRIYDGEWVYGDLLNYTDKKVSIRNPETRETKWVDIATVGQFTGLRDKNERMIYKGDIYKVTLGKHFWAYEVKMIGGQFGGMLFGAQLYSNLSVNENTEQYTYEITTENAGERQYVASGKGVEVIGNIYEHGHLIGKEDVNGQIAKGRNNQCLTNPQLTTL